MASPLPPTTPQEQDERNNPSDQAYQRDFNAQALSEREKQALHDRAVTDGMESQFDDKENDPTDDVRQREEKSGNDMNYSKEGGEKRKAAGIASAWNKNPLTVIASSKKSLPSLLIGLLLLAGGGGLLSLFSPSILLVNLAENIKSKMNTQFAAMDHRTSAIVRGKIKGTTVGCGKISVIKCKYSTMSDIQVKKFEKAGITITKSKSIVPGFSKVETMSYRGTTVTAEGFNALRRADPNFHSAIARGYNPLLYSIGDFVFKKTSAERGISKATNGLENAKDDKERAAAIKNTTKSGNKTSGAIKIDAQCDDDGKCNTGERDKPTTQGAIDDAEKTAGPINEDATKVAATGEKQTSKLLGGIGKAASSVAGFFRLDQAVSDVCTVRGSLLAVGYAGKTVRAVQMARYAMIFLTTADMIKAGVAKESDVSYLGDTVTKTVTNSSGQTSLSGTDSASWKYLADGDMSGFGKKSEDGTISQSMAGGGLSGSLIGVAHAVETILGGRASARATCGVVSNPWYSAGSAVVGLAVMLIPGGQAISGAKFIAAGATSIAFAIALQMLPAMLADTVGGVVADNSTFGAASVNLIAGGAGNTLSRTAQLGGNAPLTVDQAVAYNNESQSVASAYAADDRLTHSPLDATNPNTFMGSVAKQLLPLSGDLSSLASSASSFASVAGSSLSSALVPGLKAASTRDQYTSCVDEDYNAMGLATDPLCNVIYGIPSKYLDIDPNDVNDRLAAEIDPETGDALPDSEYAKFINECMQRSNGNDAVPLGYDDDTGMGDGSNCLLTDANITANPNLPYYYVHTVDQRVRTGMDEEEPDVGADGSTTNTDTSPVATSLKTTTCTDAQKAAFTTIPLSATNDMRAAVNSVAKNQPLGLRDGTYSFTDFQKDLNGFVIDPSIKGILGTGIEKTTVQMKPNTSTHKGDVPKKTSNNFDNNKTNQLTLMRVQGGSPLLCGFTLQGTDQGHIYNGLRISKTSKAVISGVKVAAIPGDDDIPPGETFGINDFRTSGSLYNSVEIDGSNVGSSLFGCNNSSNTNIINSSFHNSKEGNGITYYGCASGSITDTVSSNNKDYGVNFERSSGTFTLTRVNTKNNKTGDYRFVSDRGSANFKIVDPIYSGSKIIIKVNAKYQGGEKQKHSDIRVIIGGVDKTDEVVQWKS